MVKKQRIAPKPTTPPPAADTWVSNGGIDPELSPPPPTAPPAQAEPETVKGKTYPHRVSFDMETPQYRRLKRAAFESDRPMNEILREAIEDWLRTHEY